MPASKAEDGTEKAATASLEPGSRLRQAREAQGLSLEELGNELRIGAAALAALEENRFEALGATVFAKGYLKQYGTRLGLDVRELADLYERAGGKPQVEIVASRGIDMRDERPVARWVVRMLVLGIVIGGAAWWWFQRPVAAPVDVVAGDDEIAAPSTADAAADRAAAERAVAERSLEEADAVVEPGEPVATELADSAEDTAEEIANGEIAADPAPAPPGESESIAVAGAAEALAADAPAIEVRFIEDSWAEVTDEDGSRLYYDLGRAGTRVRFPADRNITFEFGKGSAVQLWFDGEPVPVPGAEQRDVVSFSLDDLRN